MSLARLLRDRGLVDGIGCQANDLERISADEIRTHLKRLETLGLTVYISEWELNWSDDSRQLQQMRSQFPIFREEPLVRGRTFWDFRPGHTWKQDAYLGRSDGSYRPSLRWLSGDLASHPANWEKSKGTEKPVLPFPRAGPIRQGCRHLWPSAKTVARGSTSDARSSGRHSALSAADPSLMGLSRDFAWARPLRRHHLMGLPSRP